MKTKKIPMRKCIGCMESKPKKELVRIVGTSDGNVIIDVTGKAQGRGAYLCHNTACFNLAKKKRAITRNLEVAISEEKLEELFLQLKVHEE